MPFPFLSFLPSLHCQYPTLPSRWWEMRPREGARGHPIQLESLFSPLSYWIGECWLFLIMGGSRRNPATTSASPPFSTGPPSSHFMWQSASCSFPASQRDGQCQNLSFKWRVGLRETFLQYLVHVKTCPVSHVAVYFKYSLPIHVMQLYHA